MAIEYAAYCLEQTDIPAGLQALDNARKSVDLNKTLDPFQKQIHFQRIDYMKKSIS
ncbi:hypothetical protein [Zavarzinella formosa]|uniref:hypothetical protein n=1 Tax=Zavarzinella formosa TaxID=360055 RepID=UPI0012F934F6|nr:hypothetical protein [Zavarzinella formosa]